MKLLKLFRYIILRELDFLIHIRKKLLLFSLFFPIFSFILLYSIFYKPVIRDIPIAIIDNDKSILSQELISNLDANQDLKVAYKISNYDEALSLVSNLSIYAFVIIPDGFAKKVLSSTGASIPYYYNAQLVLVGNLANKGIITTIQGFSSKYNKVYEEHHGVPYYASSARTEPIIFNHQVLFNPTLSYQFIMLLGLFPAMLQLFITGTFLYSYGFELISSRAKNLLNYVKSSPFTVVIGKGFPYFIIYSFNSLLMLYFLFFYIGINIEGSRFVILFSTFLYLLASSSISLILISFGFGSLRMALSIMAVYAAPAFAYAGVTYPSLGLPKLARLWSEFLPITHYHRVLINESIRGANYNYSVNDLLYLLIFFLVTFFIGTLSYRFFATNEKFWGKL